VNICNREINRRIDKISFYLSTAKAFRIDAFHKEKLLTSFG